MKIIFIILLAFILSVFSATYNPPLALEITDDDYRSYRIDKKINSIIKYSGFIVAPNADESAAIIQRGGKRSLKKRFEVYRVGDLLWGRKPDYGIVLDAITNDSLELRLIHNFDKPSEATRNISINYITKADNNIKDTISANHQYFIHADEIDIYSFTSIFLNNGAVIFAPSVNIHRIFTVPNNAFINMEGINDWSIQHLRNIGYKVLLRPNNTIIIRNNDKNNLESYDNDRGPDTSICNEIETNDEIKIYMKEAKLVAYINSFSKLMKNNNIASWPNTIRDIKFTAQENIDVNDCELFINILNEFSLRLNILDTDIVISNAI